MSNNTTGWGKVLKFSYTQTIKAKSFIVSTIFVVVVFALIIAAANFLPILLNDKESDSKFDLGELESFGVSEDVIGDGIDIKNLYFLDESGLTTADSYSFFSTLGVNLIPIDKSELEPTLVKVHDALDSTALAQITYNEQGGYNILMSCPEETSLVNKNTLSPVVSVINSTLYNTQLMNLGIPEESIAQANTPISSTITVAGEEPKSVITDVVTMVLPMVSSVILMMLIVIYGQLVTQSIATEKTSRVMELLLTSIRPLAVIIGKVLAMGLVALTQVAIIGVSVGAISLIMLPFGALGGASGGIEGADQIMTQISIAMPQLNVGSILLIVLVFLLGFLFYAMIAGLAGATVSRIEDVQQAAQPLAIISILGFYLAYMPALFDFESGSTNIVTTIGRYLPISSPFALPSAILMGAMTPVETAISIAALAVFDIIITIVVARVYESIILHTGNRMKFFDIFRLAGKAKR